jgi:hypothetical protein
MRTVATIYNVFVVNRKRIPEKSVVYLVATAHQVKAE